MRFSRRQAEVVNQIIQEEVRGALSARRERPELLRRGEIQERLVEAGPDAMRVDGSIMGPQMVRVIEGPQVSDAVVKLVDHVRRTATRAMAEVLNQHGMSNMKVDPRTLEQEMEDFDHDGVMEALMECNHDVTEALEKLVTTLGDLAVHMAGGTEPDEEV